MEKNGRSDKNAQKNAHFIKRNKIRFIENQIATNLNRNKMIMYEVEDTLYLLSIE